MKRVNFEQLAKVKLMSEEDQQKRIDKEIEEQTKDIQIDTTIVDDAFTEPLPEIPGIFFDCRDIKEFKERTRTNEDIRVQLKNEGGRMYYERERCEKRRCSESPRRKCDGPRGYRKKECSGARGYRMKECEKVEIDSEIVVEKQTIKAETM